MNPSIPSVQRDTGLGNGTGSTTAENSARIGRAHDTAARGSVRYSIVLPVYNEEENLLQIYQRLTRVLSALGEPYEIIFVNDGSRDRSREILRSLHQQDARVKLVSFTRNFGHQTAVSAGLDFAAGDAVIVMDADLQDPPECLPQFIAKWQEGHDVVYAIRTKRKENIFKRAAYALFYRLIKRIADIDIPLDSGDFCIMDQKVVRVIRSLPERNRFVRGIRSWVGFRQTGLAYERDERYAGRTHYTLYKLLTLALDGFVSFSHAPLRMAAILGFLTSGLSFVMALVQLYRRLFVPSSYVPGFASIIITVLFLGGIQLITIGIIGEYLGRIFDEVKRRPLYLVDEVLGLEDRNRSASA
ncbi:MAG: glycosyltransferase family 2 protein [candidate division KSB1 bacterium]|nr:glycosyltransferase family 2 protein [candidate division KSB1 bacterium]MDZ7275982.1 glycosyltransferase family 2 protein [candidate division KSB1 bacterium]MDZ7285736.1 glycosyltransferase family 2 protein [candidate division KSB1 bacterium]MDZ7298768.1 glycosyltransferase family 2 protein [candidate division KSB1 bacterium]MDZ7305951.1 glycosyltransferase family 2 protein [candidate division KSB1 bacterium]